MLSIFTVTVNLIKFSFNWREKKINFFIYSSKISNKWGSTFP